MNINRIIPFIKNKPFDTLFYSVSSHIESARRNVIRTVNTQMVHAYSHIGKEIFEEANSNP